MMTDQAGSLRSLVATVDVESVAVGRRTRVLAISSGKGGVGKTNIAVNLAYALMELGRSVIVLDADLGLANVDVLLGTAPDRHLGHLMTGTCALADLIYPGPRGLRLIAGGSGLAALSAASPTGLQRVVAGLGQLNGSADFLLIDTAAGIGTGVLGLAEAADEVLLVTTPEPTALADAYVLVKSIVGRNPAARVGVVMNQVRTRAEGEEAMTSLCRVVLRFLDHPLEPLTTIGHDERVAQAVRAQVPFLLARPGCSAAADVRRLAGQLVGAAASGPKPGLFFHRLARVVSGP